MKRILHQFLCGSKIDLMSTVCERHPHRGQETHIWVKRLTCTKRDPQTKTDLMSNVCERHPHRGQETHIWVKRLTGTKTHPHTKTDLFNCPMCVKSDSHSRKKTLICENKTTYGERGPHVEKETHVQKLCPPTQHILHSWTFETAFFFFFQNVIFGNRCVLLHMNEVSCTHTQT